MGQIPKHTEVKLVLALALFGRVLFDFIWNQLSQWGMLILVIYRCKTGCNHLLSVLLVILVIILEFL